MRTILYILLCIIPMSAWSTQYSAAATGNWSSSSTWSPSGVPGTNDTVTIGSGYSVTVTANASCKLLNIYNVAGIAPVNNTTLTVNNGVSLSVGGNMSQNVTVTAVFTGATAVTVLGTLSVSGNYTQSHTLSILGNANTLTVGSGSYSGTCNITGALYLQNGFLTALGNANKVILAYGTLDVDGDISYSAGAINLSATNEINANDNGSYDGLTKSLYLAGNFQNTDKGSLTLSDANSNTNFTVFYNGSATQYLKSQNMSYKHVKINNSNSEVELIDNPSNTNFTGTITIMSGGVLNTKSYNLDAINSYASQILINAAGTLKVENAAGVPAQQVASSYVCVPDSAGIIEFYSASALTVFDEDFDFTIVKLTGTGTKTYSTTAGRQINNSSTKVQRLTVSAGTFVIPSGKALVLSSSGSKVLKVDSNAVLAIQGDFTSLDAYFDLHFNSTVWFQNNGSQTVYSFQANVSATEPYGILKLGRESGSGSVNRNIAASSTVEVDNKVLLQSYANLVINSSAYLKLNSNASTTAFIDEIESSADITYSGSPEGQIIVQKYISLPGKDYRDFSSPITSAKLSSWKAGGLVFTGFTGSNYPSFSFNNAYTYDESFLGEANDGFDSASNITNDIHIANGSNQLTQSAWRIYAGSSSPIAFTLADTGRVYADDVDFLCTFNNGLDRTADDGWNFLGNPYPSAVNWNDVYNEPDNSSSFGADGIQPTVYIYKPADNGISGDPEDSYGYYNALTGVGVDLDSIIPPFQGFWIKVYESSVSSSSYVLRLKESHKYASSNTVFYKSAKVEKADLVEVKLSGGPNDDIIRFHHWKGAGVNLDPMADVQRIGVSKGTTRVNFSQQGTPLNLWVNALSKQDYQIIIPLFIETPTSGEYELSFKNLESFLSDFACVTLSDWLTGETIDLQTHQVYRFESDAQYAGERFVLDFKRTLQGAYEIKEALCHNGQGSFELNLADYPQRVNLEIQQNGITIHSLNTNPGMWSVDLDPGSYVLVDNLGLVNCESNTLAFEVTAPSTPVAAYQPPVKVYRNIPALFTNNSENAYVFEWDFGDGSPMNYESTPLHTFSQTGDYWVTLRAYNSELCPPSTTTQKIHVETPTGIAENASMPFHYTLTNKELNVICPNQACQAYVYDLAGQLLARSSRAEAEHHLALDISQKVVVLVLVSDSDMFSQKLFVNP